MKNLILIFLTFFLLIAFKKSDINRVLKSINSKETVVEIPDSPKNEPVDEPPIMDLSNSEGSIVANLSVTATGGVSYSVPINVPPGLNGVTPEISLDFDSQSGNGIAGWGWNVSGISTITRIPSTMFHDNQIDPVDFDLDDRFALDGQRLIVKSGTYGVAGSEYQTEQYSNVKILAYGSTPISGVQGPEYFKVFYPDGSIGHYGSNSNSRSHMDYAITYWENPSGVRIDYTYEGTPLRIKNISYGSKDENNHVSEIIFGYLGGTRKFPETAYIGGTKLQNTSILSTIYVNGAGANLYRKYELLKDQTKLRYDRVIEIEEHSSSGLKRSISFEYGNTTFDIEEVSDDTRTLNISNVGQNTSRAVSGDFSGNGKMDFVVYPITGSSANQKFWIFDDIQNSQGFAFNEHNIGSFEKLFPVNWLNYQNVLMPSQGLVAIQNTGSSQVNFKVMAKGSSISPMITEYTKTWNAPSYTYYNSCNSTEVKRVGLEYLSGDFDGDGLSDVVAISKGSYDHNVCYPNGQNGCSCGSTLVNPNRVDLIRLDRRITTNFSSYMGQLSSPVGPDDKFFAFDMNGDGKTDIWRFQDGKVQVYGMDKTNSNLTMIWEETNTAIDIEFPILPGDYNGDGKIDFMIPTAEDSSTFKLFSSEGNGFDEQNVYAPFEFKLNNDTGNIIYGYNLIPVDINGDFKTDIIEYNTTTYGTSVNGTQRIQVHQNSENVIPNPSQLNFIPTTTEQFSGKINHYPIPIFLTADEPNGNLDFATISDKYLRSYTFKLDHREDVTLKSVSNNGIQTDIVYDQVNQFYEGIDDGIPGYSNSYTPKYGQVFPFVNINVAPSFKVVRELEQTASGITRKKLFYYEGAVSHANGLGFLGFETVKRSGWFGNNVSALWTINKRDPMLRGAMIEQIVANSSDNNPSVYQSKVNYFYDYALIANPGSPIAPQYTEDIFRSSLLPGAQTDEAEVSITLEDGFHAIGTNGNYWGYIVPPNEQPGDVGYAGAVDIRLNRTETDNGLTGVATTETYTYDSYNNPLVTTTTYPGGSRVLSYQYSNNASATNNTYHIGKPTRMTETLTLNGSSFTTVEEYTYNNNLVDIIRRKGNGTDWITQDLDYDVYGNITKKTLSVSGESPRVQIFEYDPMYDGRFLTKSIDIDNLETTFSYDAVSGSLLSTTDVFGLTTTYGHDIWDRIITETDYLGKTTTFTTAYQSDGGTKVTTVYPEGGSDESTYNALGWELRSGTLSLNNQWSYTSYEYDASGRLIKESEPHNGSPSQWNVTNFDEYSRVISQQLYTGKSSSVTYSGLSSTVTEGAKVVTTTLDALGNTIKVTDLGGTVDYTYHASGQLKSADYDNGNTVTVGVDGWGRKTSLNDPSAGSYTYSYNNWGELLTQTSPKGTTTYDYFEDGRVKTKEIKGDLTDLFLTYAYYDGTTNQLKKITGTDNTNSSRSYVYDYVYDTYKRPENIKENTGLANFEYDIDYDIYGRVEFETQKTTFNGTITEINTKNVYDSSSGILTEIWNDDGIPEKLWELNQINARGQALTVNLGNGITRTKMYDAYGYLEEIEDKEGGTNPNPTTALHAEYNFNVQQGTLTSRENHGFNWQESFLYDNLDRLTEISGSATKTMGYNANGTIKDNTALGDYTYGDTGKKHRLTEIDPNPAGETYFQQNPTQTISYNAFKKPIDIHQQGHGRVSFEYGPLMNRSTAYYGGEQSDKAQRRYKKHYSAIIPVEIVEDTQASTTKIVTYVAGDAYSAPVAHIKTTGTGAVDEYHYLHRDYLGSILAITDASGNVKEERQFGAWGAVDQFLDSANGTTFGHDSLLGRGYTGHEHFFEVGLIHMNGRMYDANLGRFLSPDNYIQEPFNTQSYNRYGYAFNNPLMYVDPSGEFFLGGGEFLLFKVIVEALVTLAFGLSAALGAHAIVESFRNSDSGSSSAQGSSPTPSNNQGSSNIASSSSSSGKRSAFNDGGLVALNIPAVESSINASNVAFTFGDNLSYQSTQMVGVSQVGRADPLQGVTRPEGWEYNPAADAQNFAEPASEGFNITTEDVLDTAMDFIPVVGGAKDIYKGIRDGNGWMIALGAGTIVLDVVTFGGSSVVKGAVKTGIKAGGRSLAKKAAKESPKLLTSGMVPNAGGKIVSFATKETETYYRVFSKNANGGAFLTKIPPKSRAFAKQGLALPKGNSAKYIQEVTVPKDVILQRSRALPAFGKRGGLEQFQILNMEPGVIFHPGVPLK